MLEHSSVKLFLLSSIVGIHSIIILGCIYFIITASITNTVNSLTNSLSILVVTSFLLFRRCILLDVYDWIKSSDLICNHELPDYCKDNFLRNTVKKMLNFKSNDIDYTKYRLDIIKNIRPILDEKDWSIQKTMISHKIQYILGNLILLYLLIQRT